MTKQLEPSGNAFFIPTTTLEQRITHCGAKAMWQILWQKHSFTTRSSTRSREMQSVWGYLEQLNELNIWRKREPVGKLQMCRCLYWMFVLSRNLQCCKDHGIVLVVPSKHQCSLDMPTRGVWFSSTSLTDIFLLMLNGHWCSLGPKSCFVLWL